MNLPRGKYKAGDVVYPLQGKTARIEIVGPSGPAVYNVRYLDHPSMDDIVAWELGEQALDQHRQHGYMERGGKRFRPFFCPRCGSYLQMIEHGSYRGTHAVDLHGNITPNTFTMIQRGPTTYALICAQTNGRCDWGSTEVIVHQQEGRIERESS